MTEESSSAVYDSSEEDSPKDHHQSLSDTCKYLMQRIISFQISGDMIIWNSNPPKFKASWWDEKYLIEPTATILKIIGMVKHDFICKI